jgi:hypothetical protein
MLGSVWQAVPLERMREQKVLIIFTTSSMKKIYCTLLSTRSLGIHSPKSRRVFALTFLRPIFPRCGVRSTLTERVYALKLKNLGTPCFLCEILRMSQFTCQGYDLLFMLLMVAGPYPWRMFVLLLPWLQASGPVSQSASSWTAFSSFVSLRYCAHAWLGTLH